MKKVLLLAFLAFIFLFQAEGAEADSRPSLGIHILDPNELSDALELVKGNDRESGAVTVVLRADDREHDKWQSFFNTASDYRVIPIIRLATEMNAQGWRRPSKKDIVEHARFLDSLNWHRDQLAVVAFNEPNHAGEWEGQVNPESYAQILEFTLDWFHTEKKDYRVLPAGLDAAAPNGSQSMDSFAFLHRALNSRPQLVEKIDAWATHSYPNPGFVGSPLDRGKNSIRGFEQELELLAGYTDREFEVYITETGWKRTSWNNNLIGQYYDYAVNEVWNQERVKAITPFVFAAFNGQFQEFSFIDQEGFPTPQYEAWKSLKNPAPETLNFLALADRTLVFPLFSQGLDNYVYNYIDNY